MATIRISPIPQAIAERLTDESPEIIRERLQDQGYSIAGVQIYNPPPSTLIASTGVVTISAPVTEAPALIIETNSSTETELTAALQDWTPGSSQARQTVTDAISRLQTYRQTVEAWNTTGTNPPTAAQVARAVYDITTLVQAIARKLDVG